MLNFENLCLAMMDPGFYPHPVLGPERRETHISVVFLTGTWVYKLKKPLDFGFLDFRRLEDRRRFCRMEVDLNRRLSRGVYEGVVALHRDSAGRFSFQSSGPVVEYAVKMRQLPETLSLDRLLSANKARPTLVRILGRALAEFHRLSQRSPNIDSYGRWEVISANVEENFEQLHPFVGPVLAPEKWEFIQAVNRTFLADRRGLFERRIEDGRIRDGHGDLRAEHVYFFKGIQIIDCIEFNDRFRYGDVALDLAFLYMDIEHLGYPEWSRAFLAEYVSCSGDAQLYALLDFYAAYRSIVRLKVACLRSVEVFGVERARQEAEARTLMRQAYRYALQFGRPTVWVICGLPASGKSVLARNLADALAIEYFASDDLRQEASPSARPRVVPFGEGPYREGLRQHVYAHLLARAQDTLKAGRSVVLDATFSHRKWREDARRLSEDLDAGLVFVETVCSEATLRERLQAREGRSGLSDARLEHLPDMMAEFEPLDELAPETRLAVDTERTAVSVLVDTLSQGYTRACEQVARLLLSIG